MSKKFYDDNNFKDLLNDLKNLPKIDTPDDFEFKLMAKIQNKNFGSSNQESEFTLIKFLKPALSLVGVLLIFFVFTLVNQNQKSDDLIKSNINNKVGSVADSQLNQNQKDKTSSAFNSVEKSEKPQVAENNKKAFNFSSKTIDIDSELKNTNQSSVNEHGVLAGSKEFDGFGIGIPVKNKALDSMKQKIDSIRNSQKK